LGNKNFFSYTCSPQVKISQKVLGDYFFDSHCRKQATVTGWAKITGLFSNPTLILRSSPSQHTLQELVSQRCHVTVAVAAFSYTAGKAGSFR